MNCGHLGILEGFDCKKSRSCIEEYGKNIKEEYGIGVVKGVRTYDSVEIGKLTAKNQMFL